MFRTASLGEHFSNLPFCNPIDFLLEDVLADPGRRNDVRLTSMRLDNVEFSTASFRRHVPARIWLTIAMFLSQHACQTNIFITNVEEPIVIFSFDYLVWWQEWAVCGNFDHFAAFWSP